ncbi:MAG: chromate transporter [Spirochaetes bacterium]|nr:chromate transporter [Spirochaetota bacterium]MBU1081705.1 chromate transporter [Spirochaetota bacterium]
MTDTDSPDRKPGFLDVFGVFFGISAVTIGGGYVMVPVIQRTIEKRGWLDEASFYDLFATAQSVPGPLALNTALFVGRRVAGPRGFAAAFLGIMLPPFASILVLASVLGAIGEWPAVRGFLEGAFAVVPGLTAALAFNMIKKRRWTVLRAAMTMAGAVAITLSGSWAVPVFFAVVAVSWLMERRRTC